MSKFNEAVRKAILQSIENGCTNRQAAAAAGIGERTFYRWIEKGKEAKRGQFLAFAQAVEQAEAKAVMVAVSAIRRAMDDGKWQAAAWWLERRYPQHWGKREYIESKNIETAEIDDIARKAKESPEVLDALIVLQQSLDACKEAG